MRIMQTSLAKPATAVGSNNHCRKRCTKGVIVIVSALQLLNTMHSCFLLLVIFVTFIDQQHKTALAYSLARCIRIKQQLGMLVMGVCNPAGEGPAYNGLYFTDTELRQLSTDGRLLRVPVKAEHRGQELGSVVSSFIDSAGKLNCVMRIADDTVEGAIAAGLVKDGIARELSLGYSVDVAHSDNKLRAGAKNVLEISLVRKGARDACFVTAYEEEGQGTRFRKQAHVGQQPLEQDPWEAFDLSA